MSDVVIHYTRLPARTTIFRQRFVHRTHDCTVTLMEHTELARPVRADGRVILEPGAPVVWFTFDGAWHDIGRFHTADGRFTGFYANILTPVESIGEREWRTTDLCLDVWLDADGSVLLLDEDELAEAESRGDVDSATAGAARGEADRLIALAGLG
ncbi:MAG TPA: DUF402 domain-containing protein, partial [Longimicrobiales bacterium]|nr:DUF402 domain-containing protein [Longimicrobiales bacterium]